MTDNQNKRPKVVTLKKTRRSRASKEMQLALTQALEHTRISGFALVAWSNDGSQYSSWYCDKRIPAAIIPEIAHNLLVRSTT